MNKVRILGLVCSEVLMVIAVLTIFTVIFPGRLELYTASVALIYLPLGLIFNRATASEVNTILNWIAMLICLVIFAIFCPLAVAILSEQTLSVKERIYAGIICKFALLLIITSPGVYDSLVKIGDKIKE